MEKMATALMFRAQSRSSHRQEGPSFLPKKLNLNKTIVGNPTGV
jgi:hypothetical protein